MTTIATDGKIMAADSLVIDHCDTVVSTERRKVFRLEDGRILGAAGNSFDADAWRRWVADGEREACPIDSDRFVGLILHPNGKVEWVDHKGRRIETPSPAAIGSGQDYALGAMGAGALPHEAVIIACKYDPYSGGSVMAEALA